MAKGQDDGIMAKRPGGNLVQQTDVATKSQTIPLLSMWPALLRKGFIGPALTTVAAGTMILILQDAYAIRGIVSFFNLKTDVLDPPNLLDESHRLSYVISIIGAYFALLGMAAVYALCGKSKPVWCFLVVGGFTAALLIGNPPVFISIQTQYYKLLSAIGFDPNAEGPSSYGLIGEFFHESVVVGVLEEGVKIAPVALLAFLGYQERFRPDGKLRFLAGPLRRGRQWRIVRAIVDPLLVREPLDGILLAAASALGFELIETLGLYQWKTHNATQHNIMKSFNSPAFQPVMELFERSSKETQHALGTLFWKYLVNSTAVEEFSLVITRTISSPFSHIAFSGCLGYGLGLAVMRPRSAVKILLVCAGLGVGLHGLWDAVITQYGELWLFTSIPITLLAYALLATMILKARQISPTRDTNFATVVTGYNAGPVPQGSRPQGPRQQGSRPPSQRHLAKAQSAEAALLAPFVLAIKGRQLDLQPGGRLTAAQLGAEGTADVAEVSTDSNSPRALGLKNLMSVAWSAVLPDGQTIAVPPGKSLRLLGGTRVSFGRTEGLIQDEHR